MDEFEARLEALYPALQRYIRFRVDGPEAEDLVQEVCLAAYRKQDQLRDPEAFKGWILSIARNRCADYFRSRCQNPVSLEEIPETAGDWGRFGRTCCNPVGETMDRLEQRDREILRLHYWKEMSQEEIASALGIPLGTVKSRLHNAKKRFGNLYPYPPDDWKGERNMAKLPKKMPRYIIEKMDQSPFECRWEELMGYLMVPKVGLKFSWAMYDQPSGKCSNIYRMEATGKARVHGIDGVEIVVHGFDRNGKKDKIQRIFVVQLTQTHCRYLAALRMEGDVRNYITFLDSDVFMPTWGYGDNNCGHEILLKPKGDILREGNVVTSADKKFLLDVVGRYQLTILGKTYDTVCLMDLESKDPNVFSEQYLDTNGRTVLWRRFNRDDWAIDRFGGQRWSERFPDNERITVNGEVYVHWYDCISDYIL